MRVGIFGGTFDPVHIGHLLIAQAAHTALNLDKVVFVPAAQPPHKAGKDFLPADQRCRLVQLAIEDNPDFTISTVEVDRQGPSYMADTLDALKSGGRWEGSRLFLIVGADNLATFHTWHQPQRILELAELVVYPRYDADTSGVTPEILKRVRLIKAPRLEFASSFIRDRVRSGKPIRYFVPDPVARFIREHSLYAEPASCV